MKSLLKAGASAAVLLGFVVAASPSQAADVADSGCTMHGVVQGGYMLTSGSIDINEDGEDFDDPDFDTLFGEGAGLITCDAWNFQADFAYYSHETEISGGGDSLDLNLAEGHFGGAVFWRDPNAGALGLSASVVDNQLEGFIDTDYFRGGVFGELYLGDTITLGASAHYFNGKDLDIGTNKDHDGFELTANAKFYVMPNLSLGLQGDFMTGDIEGDGESIDYDGLAITGEAEYLVWDEGLSLFGGARWANRELKADDVKFEFDDLQVFVGLEFAFGAPGTSLVNLDRTGPIDNTSTMFEKLPDFVAELLAASGGI